MRSLRASVLPTGQTVIPPLSHPGRGAGKETGFRVQHVSPAVAETGRLVETAGSQHLTPQGSWMLLAL